MITTTITKKTRRGEMMGCRNSISVVTVLLALAMTASGAIAAEPPLKALIIDGRQAIYHDWKTTSPVLEEILEASGLFKVDRAAAPARGESLDDYKPKFATYDVVIMNYDDDEGWPAETEDAFVDYVRSGGGAVIFHAANNAFPDWKEYNEIIGLGGWRGRDERSGPMVRVRDGKVVMDNSPGNGGTHPAQHEFQVVVREGDHPIMKGLPEKWMNGKDELYSALRGPAKNLTVLATAYCKPGIGGTGEHEPILFTVSYGKGRVFHTPLGHAAGNMHCVAFIYTFQRGAEWAATGKVTQTEVPDDFPTADKANYRESIAGPEKGARIGLLTGDDLSAWREPLGEWKIVGGTSADPKDGRRLASERGTGVAVNGATGSTRNLVSKLEHGDIQAHVEFMMAEGSNSGVYFQGRYEIQVRDSYGWTESTFDNCGGIYQRWREEPGVEEEERGYEGRPPRVNVSRKPGEWQTFDIVFRAPRFDRDGNKTANAVFVRVEHNGVVVHENEEVTGPTRAAMFEDERPVGPLMLQGDHGPVAYRNVWIVDMDSSKE